MYFMTDSAFDMKRRLLGKSPERRFNRLAYGVTLALCVVILTLHVWVR